MDHLGWNDIRTLMKEVIEEDFGAGRYEMTPRFEGGTLIFRPADSSLKAREVPVEVFFKKITAVREKLRVLEQKLNATDSLSDTERAEFQMYVTRAYGSLTTFNFLFHRDDQRFTGMKESD